MSIKQELREAKEEFRLLSLYQRFEHVVIAILTALIAVIVVVAVWRTRAVAHLFRITRPSDCESLRTPDAFK